MADEPQFITDPRAPEYRDHLLQRLRGYFGGVKPPREEYAEARRIFMETDARRLEGKPAEQQRMMSREEVEDINAREAPVASWLANAGEVLYQGATAIPAVIGETADELVNPGRGRKFPTVAQTAAGLQDTFTVHREGDPTRAELARRNQEIADAASRKLAGEGVVGAIKQLPQQFGSAAVPFGMASKVAGTAATLGRTALARGSMMAANEGAKNVAFRDDVTAEEQIRTMGAAFAGGAASVAGVKAASLLPGAGAGPKIAAAAVTDFTASGAAQAAFAPEGQRGREFVFGGATGLVGTAFDAPGIRRGVAVRDAAVARQRAQMASEAAVAPPRTPMFREPLPPEVAPERLPEPTGPLRTAAESAQAKLLHDRMERAGQAPITPETYDIDQPPPRTADDELRALGTMEAHSGLSPLKPVADSISKSIAKGITPTGKVELQRKFQADYSKMTEWISDKLAKVPGLGNPKVLETLGLPHPNKAIRELNKARDELVFKVAHDGLIPFEVSTAKMAPEQRLELHRRAEKMEDGWDAASNKILSDYKNAIFARADAMVQSAPADVMAAERIKDIEGLSRRPFTQAEMRSKFAEYQKPGEQGYVMHIPDPGSMRAAKAISAGIWDAHRLSGLRAKLEKKLDPHVRAKVKADIAALEAKLQAADRSAPPRTADDVRRQLGGDRPGLEKSARTATDIFSSRMSKRKALTFDEMVEQGYVVGKDAMATTLLNEGQLMVTLNVMERAAKDPALKPFIMDVPNGADPAKPPKGWSLSKGEGWGPLRAKWMKDDVFKALEPAVDIRKGGVWEVAQASTSALRTAAVILSPKFHVLTNPIQSVLSMMQSIPLHRMPKVLFGEGGTASKMVDFFHSGKAHPYISELMAAGKFRRMLDLADTLETSVLSHSKDFRDIEAGRAYVKDWAKRAAENLLRRGTNVAESKYAGSEPAAQVANKGLYMVAQGIRWGSESLAGFDILKAVGIDTSKLPEGLRAKFSVEGLGDLSAMEDDFTRLSVYSYLRDMGMTREEAMKIDDAWFDVRKIPPLIRNFTRVPGIGPTFGHWGWMYFRNLFLQRHVLVSPVKSAILLAPVYMLTKATQALLGWSDEEMDESMRRAGIAPNSADSIGMAAIPTGKDDAAWLDLGSVSALQAIADLIPFVNTVRVDPGPDGAWGRAFRAQVRQSMGGTAFYKLITRMDPRTGEHGRPASAADFLRMVPFIPATVGARIIGEIDRREVAEKYGDTAADGRSWGAWFAQTFMGVRDDAGTGNYARKREHEIQQYDAGARGYTIPSKIEDEDGGGRPTRPTRPSRPSRPRR